MANPNADQSRTKYTAQSTILTADVCNMWFGGLYNTAEGNELPSTHPLVAGHVHDGSHNDGHAQKINLANHVTGQLLGVNLASDSVSDTKVLGVLDQSQAIPEFYVDGDTYYKLDLSDLRTEYSGYIADIQSDISGFESDIDNLQLKFNIQHNSSTGFHTDITADSINVDEFYAGSSQQFEIDPSGNAETTGTVKGTDFLFGPTVGGVQVSLDRIITQSTAMENSVSPNNPGNIVGIGTGAANSYARAIRLNPGESGRFLFNSLPTNSDLRLITLYMDTTSGNTYDVEWEVQRFFALTSAWLTVQTSTANLGLGETGSLTGTAGGAIVEVITLADSGGPLFAGQGLHLTDAQSSNQFCLWLKNNDPTYDIDIYYANLQMFVGEVSKIARAL